MTLTPDRQHHGDDGRAQETPVWTPESMFEQLRDAGLDLTGHSLANRFETIPPAVEPPIVESPRDETPSSETPTFDDELPFADSPCSRHLSDEPVTAAPGTAAPGTIEPGINEPVNDRPGINEPVNDRPVAGDTEKPDTRRLSRHPLLSDEAWSELNRFAPEVLDSITGLSTLESEVRSFQRPMGPDEAVFLADALEAVNRINASLTAVTLAVFERVGTPTDYGAKTTKALVQNRLGLSDAEAHRRTESAKNLGGRVDTSGQALPPIAPKAADGLHDGVLSANQAAVIADCMKRFPAWGSAELRTETEERLVKEAPRVRVSDLREIFQRMLDIVDPDGKRPSEAMDRSDYSVNLRARRNGDWELSGRLDPITGGLLNGLLTSRIESCRKPDAGTSGSAEPEDEGTRRTFELFDAVLSGDRRDAPLFAQDGSGQRLEGTGTAAHGGSWVANSGDVAGDRVGSVGVGGDGVAGVGVGVDGVGAAGEGLGAYGVRVDGTPVSTVDAQPSVRRWIYERFATLIGKIEMNRPNSGARYSLVVTAKAEDLASNMGDGKTGTENPVPVSELRSSGLNGQVFFHLMSDSAKTVQVATEKRFASAKQTAIITSRDMGCSFPGCDAPPGWCEVHHIVPWIDRGRTDINNLTLACGAHHHLIDKSDWHAVMQFNGRPAWVPPASIDPERKPILHAKFVAQQIIDTLFDP